jgi:hypothetical protein
LVVEAIGVAAVALIDEKEKRGLRKKGKLSFDFSEVE